MVRQQDWYDSSVIRSIRKKISLVLLIVILFIGYVNHEWILQLFKNIFN